MRTFDQWMDEYGASHLNPANQKIHKVCVPLITLTALGMLWSIPAPTSFHSLPYLNWATVSIAATLAFYLRLNFMMFVGMAIQSIIACFICLRLDEMGILLPFSALVFVLAWGGQFYGHKIEGKKPSFLKDLVFLLIGPLWVTRFLYQMLGIKV